MSTAATSIDRIADHFVNYLFDEYQGSRHVRRVATWIGFLLKAIEHTADSGSIQQNRTRQLTFEYRNHRFKARYDHHASARGGIEIVEVLPGQGAPDGGFVTRVTNLGEAEAAYQSLQQVLDGFIDGAP
jgi:hypothetical protein